MLSKKASFVTFLCLLSFLYCGPIFAATADAAATQPKGAVLLVAFGTSIEKARVSYVNAEQKVRAAFPGKDLRWAWTAHSLLKNGPDSAPMLSPQEALARLATEGVKDVAVLSLHIIPGAEYNALAQTARAFEGLPKGLERVHLAPPLLHDTDSLSEVANLLLKSAPKQRKADEALVFVGHGTHHAGGVYYPALQYYLSRLDARALVGTVEGAPDKEALLADLQDLGVKKVWLMPLMTVAGDHALNDLFGDEPDSWKNSLAAKGFTVEAVPLGLGEYPMIIDRWVQGLQKAIQENAEAVIM